MPKYTTKLYNKVKWRKTREGRFYEKMMQSKSFFGWLYRKTFHSPVYANINKLLLNRLKFIKPGSTILDVGGNINSFNCDKMKVEFDKHTYLRLDIDSETNPDILGDAMKMPINSGTIDLVIVKSLLEHITEPQKCIKEINRVLKPNGTVYFYVPFMQRVHASPNDYYRFTKDGLKYQLKEFVDIKICPAGGYVSTLGNLIFIGTCFFDRFYGLGFVLRCLLYPFFYVTVIFDKFDKYNLCTIGYYGLAKKCN